MLERAERYSRGFDTLIQWDELEKERSGGGRTGKASPGCLGQPVTSAKSRRGVNQPRAVCRKVGQIRMNAQRCYLIIVPACIGLRRKPAFRHPAWKPTCRQTNKEAPWDDAVGTGCSESARPGCLWASQSPKVLGRPHRYGAQGTALAQLAFTRMRSCGSSDV